MKAPLYNTEGKEAGTLEVPDALFGIPFNAALVKQVVEAEESARRPIHAHTKTRGEVRGGGKKPWKQKHTGRARHGSIRSPLWRGGGATFGPRTDRIFYKKINKKMKRLALCAALSAKLKDGELYFVDQAPLASPKTKEFAKLIKKFPFRESSVAVVNPGDAHLERAARNIARLSVFGARQLNARDLLSKKYIFFPKDALAVVEKTFLTKKPGQKRSV